MRRLHPPAVLLPLAALTTLGACSLEERTPPPDIVVVCIDTLRADNTSLHGYARPTTPELERIAGQGLMLARHHANASWTKPSVASMLTGLAPTAHGSRTGQFVHPDKKRDVLPEVEVLSDRLFALPEVLAEHGYRTCAHVTNYNMVARFGYAQGYEDYRFEHNATAPEIVHRSDREAIEFAQERLRRSEGPVFAWLHLMSVHQYAAPPTGRLFRSQRRTPVEREAVASARMQEYAWVEQALDDYDDAVRSCDRLVGELWDWLQVERPNSVLIVTSDHGEEFFEHGGFEHGSTLYQEQLHVPCVLAGAGVPTARVEGLTDSLDLFPTVLALAGIEQEDADLPGIDLLAGGRPTPGKARSFAEQHARGPWRRFSVLTEEGKLIVSERKQGGLQEYELFRRPFDGAEAINEYPGDPAQTKVLWDAIEDYRVRVQEEFETRVGERVTTVLDTREVDIFQGLGYAGGFGGDEDD